MSNLQEVKKHLISGGVVLLETDTNFALACLPWEAECCERIYRIKNRPFEKPLTLFVNNLEDAYKFTSFQADGSKELFDKIVKKYWPGPLNIIIDSSSSVPNNRFFNKETVSIVYNQKISLNNLIAEVGPLALTSANISGVTSDTLITKEDAIKNFGNDILILNSSDEIDKNTTISSTIIKIEGSKYKILRQGDVEVEI